MSVHSLVHVVLALALPPLLPGVIQKTRASIAGRRGPPLLQGYYDLARLARKASVYSATTSWVFRAGPPVGLAATLLAALLVPFGAHRPPLAFAGDLVLFAYLLGLARFVTVAAALDTGSSFEGMGGAREASFACLAEPALFLGLMVLARLSGSASLAGMLGPSLEAAWPRGGASLVLVLAGHFVVLLAETCRMPFDDPHTHLELTMIHEVMVLDHSGPALGMVRYGAALKFLLLGALVTRVAAAARWPGARHPWADWGVFLAASLVLAALVGVVESVMARLRLAHVPRLLVAAGLLSALGIFLLAR